MSLKYSACHAFNVVGQYRKQIRAFTPITHPCMPAILLKLFYSAKTWKNIEKTLRKESRNGAQRRWPEALKVWQALCFRDIWRKWETRNKKDFELRPKYTELTNWGKSLHPLLPDPPPILLKHVTKTSIAVPALPVIKPGTPDPPGIHDIHIKSPKIDEIHGKPSQAPQILVVIWGSDLAN